MAQTSAHNAAVRRAGRWLPLLVAGVSLVLALTAAEGLLRLFGYQPWQPAGLWAPDVDPDHEAPLMTRPDPVRGWANLPGEYVYDGYSAAVDSITVTIAADGSRRTAPGPVAADPGLPALVFAGGSNTFGHAISDWETFPWKLQQRYATHAVYNVGVPGYGTLQALQTLEEQLPQLAGPKLVFYGLIGHHFNRNVLDDNWMRLFAEPGKGQMPPYITVKADGSVQRNPVQQWRPWPLKQRLALVNTAENAVINLLARQRSAQMVPAMHGILREMDAVVSGHDAELVVVLLKIDARRAAQLEEFLTQAGIRVLNCAPAEIGPEYRVVGEGHPNDRLNTLWADCIGGYLEAEFGAVSQ
ncbi:MAG: hypothetical protein V2J12_08785 [Gammaproteobacteria bacterium]|jgi:hypothetical protein|nr:hypothetical protein [Gammaproteobacteria bacterium]